MSNTKLSDLEPKLVWTIFEEITQVPRASKKEEKIRAWVKDWAKKNKIPTIKEDAVGNILLAVEATAGCEDYPTLILQAHMDMVCQKKSGVEINFDTDPINAIIEGEIVKANGTTLGADNGIGMAYGLAALISEDLKHGPLEVLFTVDEETGLTGAFAVKKEFFTGKYLLNVDSESVGKITISSAGGGGTEFVVPVSFKEKANSQGIAIEVTGLLGGHSGVDINLPRLNAIKIGIDALYNIKGDIALATINAGSVHNAIPRDFACEIVIESKKTKEIMNQLKQWMKNTLAIAKISEPNIKIDIKKCPASKAIDAERTASVIDLLYDIKHGPLTYSKEIIGLVQTSSNLAVIETAKDSYKIHVSTRSSVDTELAEVRKELKETGEKYQAKVIQDEAYPGWQPNPESVFVKMVQKSYEEVVDASVELEAIHAGLECGLFLAIDPELQVTSIGPNIENAHSPDEYIEIPTAGIIWDVVRKVIENMGTL